jgi:hypothetical protein
MSDLRPPKPYPTFPLFAHRNGYWSRKVKGKNVYFARWRDDPDGAISMAKLNGETAKPEAVGSRPPKPYPDFPLNSHANGSWYKFMDGKIKCFGPWKDDPKGVQALAAYHAELASPKVETVVADALAPVLAVALREKEKELKAGTIERVTFDELRDVAQMMIDHFGPERSIKTIPPAEWSDFRHEKLQMHVVRDRRTNLPKLDEHGQPISRPRAPETVTNLGGRVKTLFNIAEELEAIESSPRYKGIMKRSTEKDRRKARK